MVTAERRLSVRSRIRKRIRIRSRRWMCIRIRFGAPILLGIRSGTRFPCPYILHFDGQSIFSAWAYTLATSF